MRQIMWYDARPNVLASRMFPTRLMPFRHSPQDLSILLTAASSAWPALLQARAFMDSDPNVAYFSFGKIFKKISKSVGPVLGAISPILGVVNPALGAVAGISGGLMTRATTKSVAMQQATGPSVAQLQEVVAASPTATGLITSPTGGTSALVTIPRIRPEVLELVRQSKDLASVSGPAAGLMFLFTAYEPMREVADALKLLGSGLVRDEGVAYYRAPDPSSCYPCRSPDRFEGPNVPEGEFYRSNLVSASVESDLGGEIYGMVRMNKLPMPIKIAGRFGPVRARIALAHELGHVANKLYKLGLSHDKVHQLGVFYATEGVPALVSLSGRRS